MSGKRLLCCLPLFLLLFLVTPPAAAEELPYRELYWSGGFSASDFLPGSGSGFYETWKLSPYGGSLTVSARLPNQSFGWWATPFISLSRYKDGILSPVAAVELQTSGDLILPPTTFDYDLMNDACAAFVVKVLTDADEIEKSRRFKLKSVKKILDTVPLLDEQFAPAKIAQQVEQLGLG